MANEIWTANQAQGWAGNPTQFGVSGGISTQSVDDPSSVDPLYWQMSQWWAPIRACVEGTQYLRDNAIRYLPRQPREQEDAWKGRVARSVFSPYFSRVIRTAIGLILRKPVVFEGGDETFWGEWRENVDRQGTDLEEFLRNQLATSIAYGHSGWLTDFPKAEGVVTLRDQTVAELKPYFVAVAPWNILGWRHDAREHMGKIQQVRIRENIAKADGRYGLKYVEQVRVLVPGGYELWEDLETTGWTLIESGQTSLSEVPLSVTYGGKMGTLYSKPPLLDIAHLNLTHYQRHADLIHALHIAAQPLLVMAGWDDLADPVGLSVNNAIVTGPRGECEVYFVEPSSSAFDAQRAELEALAEEISTLGIATLTKQKNTAESGLSKSLDRVDSNSMLALISKDLEQTLQQSLDWAAEFAGVQAPVVSLDRDFDVAAMEGQEISAINALFTSGLLDQRSALDLLKRGELLGDDFDVEEAMEAAEQEELASMEHDLAMAEGQAQVAAQYAPKPPAGAASEPKPPKAK
jgi:hypothetical protein